VEQEARPRRSALAILIDPDEASGAIHSNRLRERGYTVVTVADATAATASAARSAPAVIFYASATGRLDASDLMLALKANDATRHVPIQMLSAEPEARNRRGLNVVTRTGW
jgi:DNA-binding response OmpR family regulator